MKLPSLGLPILKMAIRYEPDIVTARQKTRRISKLLGFETQDQARLATAVSELARNVFQYVGAGHVEFFFRTPKTLYVKVTDAGSGIQNLKEILNGTYVSPSGMGIGILGAKKLTDHFQLESSEGSGTTVIVGKDLDKRAQNITQQQIGKISETLVSHQTENPFEEMQNQNRDLLNALEEIKAAKAELSELNRELAETNRGVVALYAELDEKATSLQRANEVKTSFLSNMTHEFRTPLSSIISLARILLDEIDGSLTAEQNKQIMYICRSSEGLLELVNDLLDLAKVEAGKVSIRTQEFDVDEVLSSIRGVFRPILSNIRDVELMIEPPKTSFGLSTDQGKISQILRNLVSNAIKFTEHGCVTVTTALEGDKVHFIVRDSGVGIAPEFLETIFEDFSQLESRLQRQQKGTGLGLPLSRKLTRLLGGDLWVESTVGVGSAFHVVLPQNYTGANEGILISGKEPAREKAIGWIDEPLEPSSNFRVLVIDDDEPSRYVLKNLVEGEIEADFLEATTGKVGLQNIKTWRPDVVFLDLSMPEVDGFTVLQKIRESKEFGDLPVIINTAKILTGEERRILEAAATAVLSKERTNRQLSVEALRNALSKCGFDYKNKDVSHDYH
ncbi:MAG: ATP-binding protein [Oligoflexales bacterium]